MYAAHLTDRRCVQSDSALAVARRPRELRRCNPRVFPPSPSGHSARLTSTEIFLAKSVEVSPSSKISRLIEGAKERLDQADGASDPARNAWLAFLALYPPTSRDRGGLDHENTQECKRMTADEKKRFVDAILVLKTQDSVIHPGAQSRYDDFVETHLNAMWDFASNDMLPLSWGHVDLVFLPVAPRTALSVRAAAAVCRCDSDNTLLGLDA